MRRSILGALIGAAVLALGAKEAFGQQTIFNVPSPDVFEAGKVYVENDWYSRPWETESGRAAIFFVRGVFGVGSNVELGVNTGPFDLMRASNPFADIALKWRPLFREFGGGETPGAIGLYGGTHAGIGLRGAVAGDLRNLTYSALRK